MTHLGASVSQSPCFSRAALVYRPTGTDSGLPMAIFCTRPDFRSPSPTSGGIFTGAMSTREFPAKLILLPGRTNPPFSALSMLSWSAEAKTSAGAPWAICCNNDPVAAKLKLTFTPGFFAANDLPSSLNDSVRLAAAETRISVSALAGDGDQNIEGSTTNRQNKILKNMTIPLL